MSQSDAVVAGPAAHYREELDARISSLRRRGVFGALAVRGRLRRELEQLGVRRSHTSDAPVWALATLLFVAAASATIGAATRSLDAQTAVGLAVAVLTVAGLLVALLQWRHGLSEKAFDALYSRIAMSNQMRLEVFKDLSSDREQDAAHKRPELYRFFVFTEIDSLEYAARRYRFGLGVNADIVDRAIRHFRARCRSDTFRHMAGACARDGAYFPETKSMVESIVTAAQAASGLGRLP